MDAEKEIFDLVFESDEQIYALSQPTNETNCLYLAEGSGGLTIWDNRVGKPSSHWDLHDSRINTIDFNCENPHIVATSSSDATACTWDLRYTDKNNLTALRTFTHKRSVQSVYFSPSGGSLATTRYDVHSVQKILCNTENVLCCVFLIMHSLFFSTLPHVT